MGTAVRKAMKREAKRQALSALRKTAAAPEARKEILRLASSWGNRGENEGAFWKASSVGDTSRLRSGANTRHVRSSL